MFLFVYNIGIIFYGLAITVASFFNTKAKDWKDGRIDLWYKLQKWADKLHGKKIIWMHCASLGEYEQGRNLLELIKANHSEYKILLTFFSPSGYDQTRPNGIIDFVSYLPLDTKHNARKFLKITQPDCLIIVKSEFWFNLIHESSQNEIPIVLISTIINKPSYITRKWPLELLKNINYFFVQDRESERFLKSKKIKNVMVIGDTRLDRAVKVKELPFSDSLFEKNENNSTVIYGSIWRSDLRTIIPFIETKRDSLHIIVPHDVSKENIRKIKVLLPRRKNVILIDRLGVLSRLYRYGDIAYVGGGFGKGIHNTLEPAAYGIPIIFGPRYKKFIEATNLIQIGAAFSVNNTMTFEKAYNTLMKNKPQVNDALEQYFESSKGATENVYMKLSELGYV